MMTKYTDGMKVVIIAFSVLLFLLTCSFFVSFHKMDLLYIIATVTFLIKFFRLK